MAVTRAYRRYSTQTLDRLIPEPLGFESFQKDDSPTLGPLLSWGLLGGSTFSLAGHTAVGGGTAPTSNVARADVELGSSDQWASIACDSQAPLGIGVALCCALGAEMTCYLAFQENLQWVIGRFDNGVFSSLSAGGYSDDAPPVRQGDVIRFVKRGTRLAVWHSTPQSPILRLALTATDATPLTYTRAGLFARPGARISQFACGVGDSAGPWQGGIVVAPSVTTSTRDPYFGVLEPDEVSLAIANDGWTPDQVLALRGRPIVVESWDGQDVEPPWRTHFYSGTALAGAPLLIRDDRTVNFSWPSGSPDPAVPATSWSARFWGLARFHRGTTSFRAESEDGVRLYVDGALVLDGWTSGLHVTTGTIDLEAGWHTLDLQFYQQTGPARLHLIWSPTWSRRLDAYTGVVVNPSMNTTTITLRCASLNPADLNTKIPKGPITATDFPLAVDIGKTPAVPFGLASRVPMWYVHRDLEASVYRYVCRRAPTVVNVYRGWQESLFFVDPSEYVVDYGIYPGYTTLVFPKQQVDVSGGNNALFADLAFDDPIERNPIRVMRLMLNDPVWGIGKPYNADSFAAAEALIEAYGGLWADGYIDDPRATTDYLRQLMMYRGIRLWVDAVGDYQVSVDTGDDTIVATLQDGLGEGGHNILDLSDVEGAPLLDMVKLFILKYRRNAQTGDFAGSHSRAALPEGQEWTEENIFVDAHETADRMLDFLAKTHVSGDKRVTATLGPEGHIVQTRNLVSLTHQVGFADARMRVVKATKRMETELALRGTALLDYVYTPGALPEDGAAHSFADFSNVVPANVTGLSILVAESGIETGVDDNMVAYHILQFTSPGPSAAWFAIPNQAGGPVTFIAASLTASARDAILRGLSAVPRTIEFEAGVHLTDGSLWSSGTRGWVMQSRWRLVGAGVGVTTLRLNDVESNFGQIIRTFNAEHCEIADITFDGNYTAIKAAKGGAAIQASAIGLMEGPATAHWIHDVAIMGCGNDLGESFPILVGTTPPSAIAEGVLIERVVATDWRGGSCTAIAVYNARAMIRDCAVSGGYQIAYGGWITPPGCTFRTNTASGVDYGFNVDSLMNTGLTVEDNIFTANLFGLVLGGPIGAGSQFPNVKIRRNTLTVTGSGDQCIRTTSNITNPSITDNILQGPAGAFGIVQSFDAPGTEILYNLVDAALGNTPAAGALIWGNEVPGGGAPTNLGNSQASPPPPAAPPTPPEQAYYSARIDVQRDGDPFFHTGYASDIGTGVRRVKVSGLLPGVGYTHLVVPLTKFGIPGSGVTVSGLTPGALVTPSQVTTAFIQSDGVELSNDGTLTAFHNLRFTTPSGVTLADTLYHSARIDVRQQGQANWHTGYAVTDQTGAGVTVKIGGLVPTGLYEYRIVSLTRLGVASAPVPVGPVLAVANPIGPTQVVVTGWFQGIDNQSSDGATTAYQVLQLATALLTTNPWDIVYAYCRVDYREVGQATYHRGYAEVSGRGAVQVKVSGLIPGRLYEYELVSVSTVGTTSDPVYFAPGTPTPGDTVGPGTQGTPSLMSQHLREFLFTVACTNDADLKTIEYEIRTASGAGGTQIGTGTAPAIRGSQATIPYTLPVSVAYGSARFIRVRGIDNTGNVSPSWSGSLSFTASRTVTDDYGSLTVATQHIVDRAISQLKRTEVGSLSGILDIDPSPDAGDGVLSYTDVPFAHNIGQIPILTIDTNTIQAQCELYAISTTIARALTVNRDKFTQIFTTAVVYFR